MKRFILVIAFFAIVYSLFPSLKAIAKIITLTMIAAVACVVAVVYLFKILGYVIQLSKNDKCKIYQEKDGKITRIN